ncbi:LacI family DNA-binding transcriptional regulator [Arthrobacter sp. FW306-05-C]|uniref:LacI family DNA-binding transcriptional regulator n=1 Tax=Arthrobacter TaxID=1663 RepID=UPI001EF13624|nr:MULTISPECIES: LacI family DNA-binding transcriptional regulator [Arthrobacter]MDP9985842.1 LacI family transcriptional regulator [Arthrobacter oryzae]UKA66933.1 LacI family DNA-binding transcriptional regulator [Arthrobacter sp. FW306-05-C]UKA71248.1 LacI family DNA-binding transcriptional regulator [Arthrobacter sp. FW306-06-A]
MRETQRPAVTISAIAAEAGVSVPTVSRVLNGRGDVSPRTRERVENLLRDHGYKRRGVRPEVRSGLIDLVFNDLDSPWAVEIIRGVEEASNEAGASTVVSAIHRRAGTTSTRQWLDNLSARATDGAILVTTDLDPFLQAELQRLDVPVVVVDPAGVPDLEVPTIGATNWMGAVGATEHLTGLGHRRIGFVAGVPGLWCSRARLDGYRAGLDAADIAFDPALVVEGDFDYESGFRAGCRLLELADRPSAVFAASDQMALGVYEAVRKNGLRVPEDISVVGFDDLPEARWASPPLTTVRQPLAEMGKLAARTILRMLQGEGVESPRVELATRLVPRESTAPPRRQ